MTLLLGVALGFVAGVYVAVSLAVYLGEMPPMGRVIAGWRQGRTLWRGVLALSAAVACVLAIRRHAPERQLIGGWRCRHCGLSGADLGEYDRGAGYVARVGGLQAGQRRRR